MLKYTPEDALELAQSALIFLGQDQDRIGQFLALTGAGPGEIRTQISDPLFLGGVLDYLLGNESLLIEFAEANEIDPELPGYLRQHLPGAPVE